MLIKEKNAKKYIDLELATWNGKSYDFWTKEYFKTDSDIIEVEDIESTVQQACDRINSKGIFSESEANPNNCIMIDRSVFFSGNPEINTFSYSEALKSMDFLTLIKDRHKIDFSFNTHRKHHYQIWFYL
mgnify:CR=1 FL=1